MNAARHIAVWIAAIVFFVLGAIWYTVLSARWLAAIGKTMEQIDRRAGRLAAALRDRLRRDPGDVLRAVMADRAAAGDDARRGHAIRRRGCGRVRRRESRAELRLRVALRDTVADQRRVRGRRPGALPGPSSAAGSAAREAVQADGNAMTSTTTPHWLRGLRACYTGAVHDVLRMMGHDRIALPPAIKSIAAGVRLAGPGVDGRRPYRPHEDAPRMPARLVHAAVEGAARSTSSCASRTTTRSR